MNEQSLVVSIEADTQGFETALKELEKQASSFGNTVTGALKSAVVSGKSLEDTLRSITLSMAGSALSAGLAPLQGIINNVGGNLFSSFANVTPFARGGISGGGIIANPTYFPSGNKIGLMGEAGSEAIMPLKRSNDGSLGVAVSDTTRDRPTSVIVNISTPDVAGFQRSSSQISASLARAVARGQRAN